MRVMTNLMVSFFLFMSSSSCLAMAFLWADDDDDEEEAEAPFSGRADLRRFLAAGGCAPPVKVDSTVQCGTPSSNCAVRTRV